MHRLGLDDKLLQNVKIRDQNIDILGKVVGIAQATYKELLDTEDKKLTDLTHR